MNGATSSSATGGGADLIMVLNCGSSSIKFAVFDASQTPLPRQPLWGGKVQGIGGSTPTLEEAGGPVQALVIDDAQPYHAALEQIERVAHQALAGRPLRAVAHRVVHGGHTYSEPVQVDAALVEELRALVPLAPLHQPFALEAIEAMLQRRPELPQFACFDTAFHHTLPAVEQMLPLPYAMWERGIRRYGFHGLSYEYLAVVLSERFGARARGRVVAAHLGSGASLCAMQGLKSVATTMGFSALDGLMMGTRTGSLDPGVLLYLLEVEKLSIAELEHLVYHDSGLLGVSATSADPRVLLDLERRNDVVGHRARAALALYVRRIVREVGALAAVLGGMDMLVFTAGVGEHSAQLRERICTELCMFDIQLDLEANCKNAPVISLKESQVQVVVEPTNEEWVAANQAIAMLCLRH